MVRKAIAFVVAATFLAACTAHVQINSNPQGARVWVNDKDVGVTPASATLDYNAFTQHRVRIEKPGYQPYDGTLRTDINIVPVVASILCVCMLPTLCWAVQPVSVQNFDLVPMGAGSPQAITGAPSASDRVFIVDPYVPASAADRFFPAMEAAARGRSLTVWRSEEVLQIQPEPGTWLRYRLAGEKIELQAAIERPGADAAAVEARLRKLHEDLMAEATAIAERSRALESTPSTPGAPGPTPYPTQEPAAATPPPPEPTPQPTPQPTKKPGKYKTDVDRPAEIRKCASGSDCGPREFCKDRGDGEKVCMGNNVKGEFCLSNIDCAPGLSCKVRDDGLKECR